MTAKLTSKTIDSLSEVNAQDWDACANPDGLPYSPFLTHDFLSALEQSGSAIPETGWKCQHILVRDEQGALRGCLPLYLKGHSRGEFVFDQGWAEAYEQAGGRYYPKLLCGVPFTPISGRRLLLKGGAHDQEVASILIEHAMALTHNYQLSSLHINFIDESQLKYFDHADLLVREGHQFQFENQGFENFDDFLTSLSSRKRKAIRKERKQAVQAGLEIKHLTSNDLTNEHWDIFYKFYTDTGERKWGTPYLTRSFFSLISDCLGDQVLLVLAYRDGEPIAGALNFIGSDTLYGRYWGSCEYHPSLHFELCYYQAIEYAIDHGLARVEAGAQGEHKLARGYLPTQTNSIHYLPDTGFRKAVAHFLSNEQRYIKMEHEILSEHSPFRRTGEDPSASARKKGPDMEKRTYQIEGMTCGGCTSSLEKRLLLEEGIEAANASHETNSCEVSLDPAAISDERIEEITTKAGFEYKGKAA